MPELDAEATGVDREAETAGEEVASEQEQESAGSKISRTEPAPGRLPARAARTGGREGSRFLREL
jgi:hypothetical protein